MCPAAGHPSLGIPLAAAGTNELMTGPILGIACNTKAPHGHLQVAAEKPPPLVDCICALSSHPALAQLLVPVTRQPDPGASEPPSHRPASQPTTGPSAALEGSRSALKTRSNSCCSECGRLLDVMVWGLWLTSMVLRPYTGPRARSGELLVCGWPYAPCQAPAACWQQHAAGARSTSCPPNAGYHAASSLPCQARTLLHRAAGSASAALTLADPSGQGLCRPFTHGC